MNRAFLIILIPALLVMAGYIFVLRMMGIAFGYSRLIGMAALLLGAIYWLSTKDRAKDEYRTTIDLDGGRRSRPPHSKLWL